MAEGDEIDDEELDELALAIERRIAKTDEFLDDLPDFAPRSQRSRKLQRALGKKP